MAREGECWWDDEGDAGTLDGDESVVWRMELTRASEDTDGLRDILYK